MKTKSAEPTIYDNGELSILGAEEPGLAKPAVTEHKDGDTVLVLSFELQKFELDGDEIVASGRGGVFSFSIDSETANSLVATGKVTWKDDPNAIVTKEDLEPVLAEIEARLKDEEARVARRAAMNA